MTTGATGGAVTPPRQIPLGSSTSLPQTPIRPINSGPSTQTTPENSQTNSVILELIKYAPPEIAEGVAARLL